MSSISNYPIKTRKLSKSEGGGFLASAPDLPGCMGDGETKEEAVEDCKGAIASWLLTAKLHNDPIPEPSK